jgi:hypothetical protein
VLRTHRFPGVKGSPPLLPLKLAIAGTRMTGRGRPSLGTSRSLTDLQAKRILQHRPAGKIFGEFVLLIFYTTPSARVFHDTPGCFHSFDPAASRATIRWSGRKLVITARRTLKDDLKEGDGVLGPFRAKGASRARLTGPSILQRPPGTCWQQRLSFYPALDVPRGWFEKWRCFQPP